MNDRFDLAELMSMLRTLDVIMCLRTSSAVSRVRPEKVKLSLGGIVFVGLVNISEAGCFLTLVEILRSVS